MVLVSSFEFRIFQEFVESPPLRRSHLDWAQPEQPVRPGPALSRGRTRDLRGPFPAALF